MYRISFNVSLLCLQYVVILKEVFSCLSEFSFMCLCLHMQCSKSLEGVCLFCVCLDLERRGEVSTCTHGCVFPTCAVSQLELLLKARASWEIKAGAAEVCLCCTDFNH